jgi:hypothetical protein
LFRCSSKQTEIASPILSPVVYADLRYDNTHSPHEVP